MRSSRRERVVLGSATSAGWLVAGVCLMVLGSVAAVVFDWPGLVAVLAVLPGLFVLGVGRTRGLRRRAVESDDETPKPTWLELGVAFAPILVLCLAASYVFDTTRWAWLGPFMTLMVVGIAAAESLARHRAGLPSTR